MTATPKIHPVAESREFGLNELFFSITDLKSRIKYGNPVFTRISGYEQGDLFGATHNIVRHPDMPRCVFKLLWDYIESGRTIAAYVKNMAADGRYYWVLALVTPCEGGYLSVRLKPSSQLFAAVESIYAETLAIETQHEKATENRRTAMEAGLQFLVGKLTEAGFENYDAFMRKALSSELLSRSAALGSSSTREYSLGNSPSANVARDSAKVGTLLNSLFASVDSFQHLNAELQEKSTRLFDIAETLHFESLNAKIAAGKLQTGAAVVGAISRELSSASREAEALISEFIKQTSPMSELIGGVVLDISSARLEAEVCEWFGRELAACAASEIQPVMCESLATLVTELTTRGQSLDERLHELLTKMSGLGALAEAIMSKVVEMKAVQFAGVKESASRRDAAGFDTIFESVGERIACGKADCAELIESIAACVDRAKSFAEVAPEVRRLLNTIEAEATAAVDEVAVA